MKRRDFLRALVGGTVGAFVGGAPKALAGEVPMRMSYTPREFLGGWGVDWGDGDRSVVSRWRNIVNLRGDKLLLFDGVIDAKEMNVYESPDRGESWTLRESVPIDIEEVP